MSSERNDHTVDKLTLKSLTVEELVVRHPNGKYRATIQATPSTVGVWLGDDKTPHRISIFATDKLGTAVGFYARKPDERFGHIMPLALSISEKDEITLQFARDGELEIITLNHLLDHLKATKDTRP